jgi:hypothetical protein
VVVSQLPAYENKSKKARSSCTTLPKERKRILRKAAEQVQEPGPLREFSLDAGIRTPLDFVAANGPCGATGNCEYTGYAPVQGCLREIATVMGQPMGTVRDPRQSWPMLVTGWHMSGVSSAEEIQDFRGGRYEVLNSHLNCAAANGEVLDSLAATELTTLKRRYVRGDDECVYDADSESDGMLLGPEWYRARSGD